MYFRYSILHRIGEIMPVTMMIATIEIIIVSYVCEATLRAWSTVSWRKRSERILLTDLILPEPACTKKYKVLSSSVGL